MIPRAKEPETPKLARQRLQGAWKAIIIAHLQNPNLFPMEVALGKPSLTATQARTNVAIIKAWIDSWHNDGVCTWISKNHRTTGTIRHPNALAFTSAHHLASWLGGDAPSLLRIVETRFEDLIKIHHGLRTCAKHWPRIAAFDETQHQGLLHFLTERRDGVSHHNITKRGYTIAGFHGKWIENNTTFLAELLDAMGLRADGQSHDEAVGFYQAERQILWLKMHPNDMTAPFGAPHFAVPPSAVQALPKGITQAVVVENLDTFLAHLPHPGTCLVFGYGNAAPEYVAKVLDMHRIDLIYWGDMDGHGYRILGRARGLFPNLRSVFMGQEDANTFTNPTQEPEGDRYLRDVPNLTVDEQSAMLRLRAQQLRIEQEHLRPSDTALAAIGLSRSLAAPVPLP